MTARTEKPLTHADRVGGFSSYKLPRQAKKDCRAGTPTRPQQTSGAPLGSASRPLRHYTGCFTASESCYNYVSLIPTPTYHHLFHGMLM
eukprot:6033104-Pyramimonas_sp.AAC.1